MNSICKNKNCMILGNLKSQIYGSKSSHDYDIIIFVDKLGTIQESHELIEKYDELLSKVYTDKMVNCNLGVLENGQIIETFKGYPFEVNNSLYYTFKNHDKNVINHTDKPYEITEYVKHLKINRCFRFILSFYSRIPEWRTEIKQAMKGDILQRIECIKKINFIEHTNFPNKKDSKLDIFKTFGFQLTQTLSLFNNIEIYSKEDVIKHYPKLKNVIDRIPIKVDDLLYLQELLNDIIKITENELLLNNIKNFKEDCYEKF